MTCLPDYWSDVQIAYVRMQLRELKRFDAEGERLFNFGFNDLKAEVDQLSPEDWHEVEDHYISQRDELESLRDLKAQFAIVGLFTVFEMFLRNTLQHLLPADEVSSKPKPGKRWNFDDMKSAFADAGVRITKPEADWQAIKKLQAIRHCITHLGGLPNEEATNILRGSSSKCCRGRSDATSHWIL